MFDSKKSIIVHLNEEVAEYFKDFAQYFPKEEDFKQVATLGKYDFSYIYFTNFKSTKENFAKLFKTVEEDVKLFTATYDDYSDVVWASTLAFELVNYRFEKYKSEKDVINHTLEFDILNDEVHKAQIYSRGINNTRTLVNEPSNSLTVTQLSEYMKNLASDCSMSYDEVTYEELVEMKAGGILAVNAGSSEKARISILKYQGKSTFEKPIALVGKGLIFDTGGYSLKPTTGIVGMKTDMGGAATMLGVIEIIAKLKLPVNIICAIPITDNLINEKAYRPDDVIKMLNKKTVEIISTDAEGRLILADALTYIQKYDPQLIVDAATLTGAVLVALGTKTAGVFSNEYELGQKFVKTCLTNSELAWQLPINENHRSMIKGKIADLSNSGGRYGGSSTAAAFLENFVEDKPWIHLDIAGVAASEKPTNLGIKGGTGAIVLSLVKFIEDYGI